MKGRAIAYVSVAVLFLLVTFAGYRIVLFLHKGFGGEGVKYVAYFHDATGLVEKSRVQVSGLALGSIVERKLADPPPRDELVADKRFARITISLDPSAVIYENAILFKKSLSLLGEYYLEIDPGTPSDPGNGRAHRRLRAGEEIREVREAASTDDILRAVHETLPPIRDIATDIRDLTKPGGPIRAIAQHVDETIIENRETIRTVLENLEASTEEMRDATAGAGGSVREIIDNMRAVSTELRNLVASSGGDVKETTAQVRQTADRLALAIEKLDRTMASLADISEGLGRGEGTIGRLLKDEELVDDLEETVEETGTFVRSITRLQTIVGLRSEYNVRASTLKSYVSLRLQPRADAYYLIELVDDPGGSRATTEITEIVDSDDPTGPQRTTTKRTEVSDAFRFSFQFAKRLALGRFALTGRFGIKESTGGVGIDAHYFFQDRRVLELETDVFDIEADRRPRLKSLLAWEFFKNLYLVAGIDDLLNESPSDGGPGGRDYFVGAQLRFNDEDLRGLLFVGGSSLGAATK
ncbi:MAG: MlaD family protein [Myxococcota bacterium]